MTYGDPLCEKTLVPRVIRSYVQILEEHQLKPVWCCVSKPIENHLASEYEWRAVIAVAEERLNPTEEMPESNDKTVRRKIHRAGREGVEIIDVEVGHVEDRVRQEIEQRCREWEAGRKGTQIHLTGARPFDDMAHRKYYYALDKEQRVSIQLSAVFPQLRFTAHIHTGPTDLCAGRFGTTSANPRLPDQMGS